MLQKVLVVDDDAEARLTVSDLLSKLNINHAVVSSAGACLSELVDRPAEFSMVLMEVHMPQVSGIDASTWIRDCDIDPPRNIPIVAMTADADYLDESYIARFGMWGALAKPVTLQGLRAALSRFTPSAL